MKEYRRNRIDKGIKTAVFIAIALLSLATVSIIVAADSEGNKIFITPYPTELGNSGPGIEVKIGSEYYGILYHGYTIPISVGTEVKLRAVETADYTFDRFQKGENVRTEMEYAFTYQNSESDGIVTAYFKMPTPAPTPTPIPTPEPTPAQISMPDWNLVKIINISSNPQLNDKGIKCDLVQLYNTSSFWCNGILLEIDASSQNWILKRDDVFYQFKPSIANSDTVLLSRTVYNSTNDTIENFYDENNPEFLLKTEYRNASGKLVRDMTFSISFENNSAGNEAGVHIAGATDNPLNYMRIEYDESGNAIPLKLWYEGIDWSNGTESLPFFLVITDNLMSASPLGGEIGLTSRAATAEGKAMVTFVAKVKNYLPFKGSLKAAALSLKKTKNVVLLKLENAVNLKIASESMPKARVVGVTADEAVVAATKVEARSFAKSVIDKILLVKAVALKTTGIAGDLVISITPGQDLLKNAAEAVDVSRSGSKVFIATDTTIFDDPAELRKLIDVIDDGLSRKGLAVKGGINGIEYGTTSAEAIKDGFKTGLPLEARQEIKRYVYFKTAVNAKKGFLTHRIKEVELSRKEQALLEAKFKKYQELKTIETADEFIQQLLKKFPEADHYVFSGTVRYNPKLTSVPATGISEGKLEDDTINWYQGLIEVQLGPGALDTTPDRAISILGHELNHGFWLTQGIKLNKGELETLARIESFNLMAKGYLKNPSELNLKNLKDEYKQTRLFVNELNKLKLFNHKNVAKDFNYIVSGLPSELGFETL